MRYLRNICFAGIGLFISLGLSELFVRHADIVEYSRAELYPDIGKGFRTSFPYTYFSEGFAMGELNRFRYASPAYPVQKPEGVKRVALIGDSYIEGLQLFARHHFERHLEDNLNQGTFPEQWQVLNMGRSNFHLGNMYAYWKLFVTPFEPDVVLWFLSEDDLSTPVIDPLLPLTLDSLDTQPFLPGTSTRFFGQTNELLKHSALAAMLNNGRRSLQARGLMAILLGIELSSKNESPAKESIPSLEFSTLTKAIINDLPPKQVILIWREPSTPPPVLQQLAYNNELQLWHIAPPLDQLFSQGIHPFYWPGSRRYGHWNRHAHEAIGKWLASQLLSN